MPAWILLMPNMKICQPWNCLTRYILCRNSKHYFFLLVISTPNQYTYIHNIISVMICSKVLTVRLFSHVKLFALKVSRQNLVVFLLLQPVSIPVIVSWCSLFLFIFIEVVYPRRTSREINKPFEMDFELNSVRCYRVILAKHTFRIKLNEICWTLWYMFVYQYSLAA